MIGSEYTINGVTYRNLEAQVARNQELSLEAAQKATEATNKITGFETTVSQGFEQVLELINQQQEALTDEIADVRNDIKSYTLINQQVWTTANNPVPNAVWEGKLWADGTFDVYTIISGNFQAAFSGNMFENFNIAVTGNQNESVTLPFALGNNFIGSKEVMIINDEFPNSGCVIGVELSANNLVSNSNTRFYNDQMYYSGWDIPYKLIIHVHGKAVV